MNDFRQYKGIDYSIYLSHYGVGHDKGGHSGRYAWGSGDRPKQSLEGIKYANRKTTRIQRMTEEATARALNKKSAKNAQTALNLLEKQKAKDVYATRKKSLIPAARKISQENIDRAEEMCKKIIKEYSDAGYTIDSKAFIRDATLGEHIATAILFTPGFGAIGIGGHILSTGGNNFVKGKKYKVRDKK